MSHAEQDEYTTKSTGIHPKSRSTETAITGTYSSPISRHYRLRGRDDIVPRDQLPCEFVDSAKRISSQVNRAFAADGPATALFAALIDPYMYKVTADDLDLPQRVRHPRCIRKPEALQVWRDALRQRFAGAFFFKFEVGEDDGLHVHIIADRFAGLPDLTRDSEACKPVYDPKGAMDYLSKPPCYPIKKRVREYVRAKKRVGDGKLPEVSGYKGLPPKSERTCQSASLETPSQTQKIEVAERSCIYRALVPSRPRPLTFESLDPILFDLFTASRVAVATLENAPAGMSP